MIPTKFPRGSVALPVVLLLSWTLVHGDASPLDAAGHAGDAPYQSDFDDDFLDMDASLPWRERFTADGAFDGGYRLDAAASGGSPDAREGAVPTSGGGYDTRGVVDDVRAAAGKLKISHGPIERLGMPGMTMLFSVEDPSMLDGLEPDDEIEFDVESTDKGFVIKRLRRTEAGR